MDYLKPTVTQRSIFVEAAPRASATGHFGCGPPKTERAVRASISASLPLPRVSAALGSYFRKNFPPAAHLISGKISGNMRIFLL